MEFTYRCHAVGEDVVDVRPWLGWVVLCARGVIRDGRVGRGRGLRGVVRHFEYEVRIMNGMGLDGGALVEEGRARRIWRFLWSR